MNEPTAPSPSPSVQRDVHIDRLCDEYEQAWRGRSEPRIEDYLERLPESARGGLLHELLLIDWELRRNTQATLNVDEYLRRFPAYEARVRAAWIQTQAAGAAAPARAALDETLMQPPPAPICCPHCSQTIDSVVAGAADTTCPACGTPFTLPAAGRARARRPAPRITRRRLRHPCRLNVLGITESWRGSAVAAWATCTKASTSRWTAWWPSRSYRKRLPAIGNSSIAFTRRPRPPRT